MTIISVIVGRHPRGPLLGEPAKWILQHLKKRERSTLDFSIFAISDAALPIR